MIGGEPSVEVRLALIGLLDHQSERRVRTLELALRADFDQFQLSSQTKERSAQEDRHALSREAWIEFGKWLAPAAFACTLGWWMARFFQNGNRDAAIAIRELLLLMIGGALGWIARKG